MVEHLEEFRADIELDAFGDTEPTAQRKIGLVERVWTAQAVDREVSRLPNGWRRKGSGIPSSLVVLVTETSVSVLVLLHSAPTITARVRSVTLPDMWAPSVCAKAAAADKIRKVTSTEALIEHSPPSGRTWKLVPLLARSVG
jgi:hypothetical protein